jgi:hypothetical protein
MIQPRNFVLIRQCVSYITLPSTFCRSPLSISRCLLQPVDSNSQSSIFVPTASTTGRTPFSRESPVKQPELDAIDGAASGETQRVSIDNFHQFEEARRLVQTGKLSGRTVSCPMGKMGMAFSTLNKIIKENGIKEEFSNSRERLTPSEARRQLRAKRHRRRFKQGVARLANIVLRMRKKSF